MRRDGGVLHVTNGDAAVPLLRAAGVEGRILPWRDVLHDGPVPDVPDEELRQLRARFLSDGGYEELLAWFEERDGLLAGAERLVLWFEHDLYDQLQLVQVLASSDAPAELVQAETYLPDAPLAELEPVPVDESRRGPARAAWDALRARDPRALESVEGGGVPFLRPALDRLLEEYPSVVNGLGRSEQQALAAVGQGARTPFEAFEAAQAGEEARFMGDGTFFTLLGRLEPLLGTGELALTELGARVLEGDADFVTARWLGGVEVVPPSPAWRWDAVERRLVTMLAE